MERAEQKRWFGNQVDVVVVAESVAVVGVVVGVVVGNDAAGNVDIPVSAAVDIVAAAAAEARTDADFGARREIAAAGGGGSTTMTTGESAPWTKPPWSLSPPKSKTKSCSEEKAGPFCPAFGRLQPSKERADAGREPCEKLAGC